MVTNKLRDKARELRSSIGRQRGFPLVALVAVMAILAILVAVVAPAVTETRDASIRAQAQTDSKQVTNVVADYFADQKEAETRTPHTTAVGAIGSVDDVATTGVDERAQQFISSRWPEQFITATAASGFASGYAFEFEPTAHLSHPCR